MRAGVLVAAAILAALAGRAGAIVSVVVVDGSVSLGEGTPTPGADLVRFSTTDGLRFSNEGATERELVVYSAQHALAYDQDGASREGPVSVQGRTYELSSLLHAAQSPGGAFLPLRVTTQTDMTGQAGWTKSAGCGTVDLQGSLSIPYHASSGAAQTPLLRYYQACDGNVELYVDADKDMSSGADLAYVSTSPQVLTTPEADHVLVLASTHYAFHSVSGSTVALQQARYLPAPVPSTGTLDLYLLYRFPDGHPAGVTTSTLTATATDITL